MIGLIFIITAVVISIPSFSNISANDSLNNSHTTVNPGKLAIVFGGSAALLTSAHLQNYNSWWKGERSSFHFGEDGTYTLGSDKLGHLYFTYLSSDIIGRSFRWSGIETERALLYGASLSLAFQLYVEVEDGFTKVLGFSPGDAVANIVGACYPLLQNHDPWFQNFQLKWSIVPSAKYKEGYYRTLIDDYESQYFWLSMNMSGAFPALFGSITPSFLNLAIGYSVKNIDRLNGGERELYIGFDIDMTKMPGEGAFLTTIKHVLNYFHFPSPVIRLTPSIIMYGLRF